MQKLHKSKEPFSRDDAWRLFAVWATLKGIKLPDWKYFEGTPTRKIKGRFDELSKDRKFRESIPDWIDELGVKELGEAKWTKEMAMQNKQANVILRINTLKTSKADLKLKLESEGYRNSSKLKAILMPYNLKNVPMYLLRKRLKMDGLKFKMLHHN